ncbi:hypothetical protein SNEBB_008881 [Seison nebaliae]|nr:hypothetical protein SNEBB_008881 [Seison nebaliae]
MKLNIANPTTGYQESVLIEDDRVLHMFRDKRICQEVDLTPIGERFKGCVVRITGGNDKQGFPMMRGVLTNLRVRLLIPNGKKCTRHNLKARPGDRRRTSVRGCIVDPSQIASLSCIIIKEETPMSDKTYPRRLGPKRAGKIRQLFNVARGHDLRKFVMRKPVYYKDPEKQKKFEEKYPGVVKTVAPKIQRLVTKQRLLRKKKVLQKMIAQHNKKKEQQQTYHAMLAKLNAQKRLKHRVSSVSSEKSQRSSKKKSISN